MQESTVLAVGVGGCVWVRGEGCFDINFLSYHISIYISISPSL